MASQTHTGPYQLWDKLPCRAPASSTEAAWLCGFGSSVAVFACLAGSRALPHAPASTCLFPCAPHFFRPSFLSTAPSVLLQALHAPSFILKYNPDRFSSQTSSQPPLQLASRCSPPHELATAPRHVRHFQDKAAQRHGLAAGPLRGGSTAKAKPRLRGTGTCEPPSGAELGHCCRWAERKDGLGPRPLSPAWMQPRTARAPPGRGFLRRRSRWPSAPLWRVAPTTLGPARRAQPRHFQARWTSWCCWVSRPS